MSENLKVTITANDCTASFIMTFDPNFQSDRDMRVTIDRDGSCEPEVVHLMMRVLQPGDVVVDGGANVGFFTCLASQLVGPSGLVFAVEPAPANIFKLEQNLANNQMKNVRVIKQPLFSDTMHAKTLHLAQHSGFNSLVPNEHTIGKMTIGTTTIDEVLGGNHPTLVKLDIEGAELEAVRGMDDMFVSCPYIVMELNEAALARFATDRHKLRQEMKERSYDCFILQKEGWMPLQVPLETEIVCDRENLMVLFSTPENVAKAWPKLELT